MTRDCPTLDLLAGWVEGTLSAAERGALSAHLAVCDDCRRTVVLSSSLDPAPARALDEALLARVLASRRRPLWQGLAAAAVLGALALSFWVGRSKPRPAPEAPVVRSESPAPAPVEPKKEEVATPVRPAPVEEPPRKEEPPAPAPVPVPEPAVKKEAVAEVPKPEPPAPKPEESPAPAVARTEAGETKVDLSLVFTPVFVSDPLGDLWLQREGTDAARVGVFERAGLKDVFSARGEAAGFVLEAKSTVVMEKGTEAVLTWFKPDQAYALTLRQGTVMIATDGTVQNWRVSRGDSTLTFAKLNGRLALEPRGERLAAILLEGTGEVKSGAFTRKAELRHEVVLERGGALASEKADPKKLKKYDVLAKAKPAVATEFAASFDEVKDEVKPWPYSLVAGRLVEGGPSGFYLEGQGPESSVSSGQKSVVMCGLKPEGALKSSSGMVLRFKYRTSGSAFTVRLGAYTASVAARTPAGRWQDAEIPLSAFEENGVSMLLQTPIPEVRFEASFEKKSGSLDVDAVQFLRRIR